MQSRFRLTLNYKRGERQALPLGMVIYLGLSRIVPIGELEDKTQEVRSCLPIKYQKEITAWYKDITQIPIDEFLVENSNSLKHRATFVSSNEGIDSNTISAGEDNLLIILTSLWSLKYHYEFCTNEQYKCSTLLIDEIDATLHPSLQFKLYELMRDFSEKYKIQIFFTTHSLYLIEAILKNKDTVIYLKSSAAGGVSVMKNPDILKIEMFLNSKTRQDIYKDKKIPIFTEDKQARVFLKEILNYFSNENENFSRVFSHFYLVDINFGAENLRDLFNEKIISKSFLHAICILDGDKTDDSASNNLDNKIITLPGKGSPEFIAFSHFLFLYDCSDGCRFWNDSYIESQGWGLEWAELKLKPSIQEQVNNYDRDKAKKLFSNHEDFFRHILKDWIQNQNSSLNQFKDKLKILCKKLAPYYGLKKLD